MSSSDQTQTVVGHEERDIRPGSVVGWTVGIFVLMLFAMAAMWLFLGGVNRFITRTGPPANPMVEFVPKEPPAPRLQADPLGDLEALRAARAGAARPLRLGGSPSGHGAHPHRPRMTLLLERRGGESQ